MRLHYARARYAHFTRAFFPLVTPLLPFCRSFPRLPHYTHATFTTVYVVFYGLRILFTRSFTHIYRLPRFAARITHFALPHACCCGWLRTHGCTLLPLTARYRYACPTYISLHTVWLLHTLPVQFYGCCSSGSAGSTLLRSHYTFWFYVTFYLTAVTCSSPWFGYRAGLVGYALHTFCLFTNVRTRIATVG